MSDNEKNLSIPRPLDGLKQEVWKPIRDYEDRYEVSNYGQVRRKEGHTTDSRGRTKRVSEKILKPTIAEGYLIVGLSKNNKNKKFYVHVLVAEAFLPNPENKPLVNHMDRNRSNAHVENLEWVTQRENMQHYIRTTPKKEEKKKKRTEIPAGEIEKWEIIKGFEDYEVSNFGKVRRIEGFITDSINRKRKIPGKLLTLRKNPKDNRYFVELRKNKKSKFIYIHKLVAETFLPNPEQKKLVDHFDGYTDNNIVFNLKWVTASEIAKFKSDFQVMYGGGKTPQIIITHEEKWEDVKGYEGYYQVSNYGRVKGIKRTVIGGRGGKIDINEGLMHAKLKRGYAVVRLSKNGIRENKFVHKLVAEAFIPNPENKQIINHINNITHDNRVVNLEWSTPEENIQHMVLQHRGTAKAVKQYDLEGNFIKEYPSLKNASEETNVSYGTLTDMFTRKKQMCAGYLWKMADDDTEVKTYKDPSEVEVDQYSLSGEYIQTFPSIKSAAEYLIEQGIETASPSCISKVCIGKLNYAYDFQWRHKGEQRPLVKLNKRIRRIVQLTTDGEFVKIHENIRAAEIDLEIKLNTSGIGKCLSGRQQSANGYKWMTENDYIKTLEESKETEDNNDPS